MAMYPQKLRQFHNSTAPLFVLAVCTRGRGQMLENCLSCLIKLKVPERWELEVVIVDNEQDPIAQDLVRQYAERSGFKITYRHEPDIGIPQARNHALNYALETGSEYIGFIDDDECIPEDWLTAMKEAFEYYNCDVVQGPVDLVYENNVPFWLDERRKKERPDGQLMRTAATDNVAFHRRLIAPYPEGLGLRFNSRMRFSGGSDTDFFFRATDAGALIVWSNNPVVEEFVSNNRTTPRWHFQRAFRKEANASQIYMKRKGLWLALIKYIPKIMKRFMVSFAHITAFMFTRFYDNEQAVSHLVKAGKKVMAAAGALAGLLRIKPKPYRNTDGH